MRMKGIVLAVLLVTLQIIDSLLTMWAVNHGYIELNPVIAPIAGTYWMLVVKVLPVIGVGIFAIWVKFPKSWIIAPRVMTWGLGSACVFLGIVLISNLMELIN